jgi:hypothetical protein
MGAMDSDRWRRASGHLDRVLDLPLEQREACLALLRADDPESAADVAALLDEHRRLSAEGFLDSAPPIRPRVSGCFSTCRRRSRTRTPT